MAQSVASGIPVPKRCGTRRAMAAAVLGLLGVASAAGAQPRAPETAPSGLLRGWADAREALERPESADAQLRAIARLGAAGHQRALDALIHATVTHLAEGRGGKLEQLPAVERGRLRIALARALSRYVDKLQARRALARLMTGALGSADARDVLAAGISATALAHAGTADAVETLGRALAQSTPLSEVARAALLAHPPRDLRPLLRGDMSLAHIELFEALGDQRAFMPLREVVRAGAEPLRGPAALALFRLGALETQPYARHAFRHSRVPSERLAALRILVETDDELAPRALAEVLSGKDDLATLAPEAELVAVELATRAPNTELRAQLLAKARSENENVRKLAFLALARLGGPADFFARALSGKDAPWAAQALAESSATALDAVLVDALSEPTSRAWALRALAVRLARGGSRAARAAFDRAAAAASDRGSPADRAAAAWGLALVAPAETSARLDRFDQVARRAALRQAFRGELASAAAARLRKLAPTDAERFSELVPCLLDDDARRELSTRELVALPRQGASVVPAVAGAIAERSPAVAPLPQGARATEADVRRWLGSAEPELRAATARGLGASSDTSSVGLLSELYLFEADARVRRAIARALGKRPEQSRLRTLALARRFDPDAAVRALATLLQEPQGAEGASTLTWLSAAEDPVRLTSAWGESMVAFPDPDGFIGVLDFGPGPIEAAPVPLAAAAVANPGGARDASADKRAP